MNRTQTDLFADSAAWQAVVSGQAELRLLPDNAAGAAVLGLQYDFHQQGGFVVARRVLQRPMPQEYALRFRLRGRGAVNNLELKLVDASGLNVWRHVWKDLPAPRRWRSMEVQSFEMEFAWGPAGGGVIAALGAIEFAITAAAGGAGALWLAELEIVDRSARARPRLRASSVRRGHGAAQALVDAGWQPSLADPRPWLEIDLREARRLGGLVIDWRDTAPSSGFVVRGSSNGQRWRTLYVASSAGGARSYVYLPGTTTRYLRLQLQQASAGARVQLKDFEFSRSITDYWHAIAQAEPRGWHPRWLLREQSLWTPIGTADSAGCALINEEGLVEVSPGSFSVEPMLWLQGRLYTWADVQLSQELQDGWMPLPSVLWETPTWRLRVHAEARRDNGLRLHYGFESRSATPMVAQLFLLIRPFQVTPPWQRYRDFGGVSAIRQLAWRDGALSVNGARRIVPLSAPGGFGASSFDQGFVVAGLARGELPTASAVDDPRGLASGVLSFALTPDRAGAIVLDCPRADAKPAPEQAPYDWSLVLQAQRWRGNGWAREAILPALTAAAHILALRAGPALQAGPRRYTRSWIRDATTMGAALLRVGCTEPVRDFIRWYLPYQRADGFVPCCVDQDGADPLVEHDSHGQLIALIADYHRFSGDLKFVESCWPQIEKAVAYIAAVREPNGLMPVSVSHEGYLAQPVHSYWDNAWALHGVRNAANLAQRLGRNAQSAEYAALAQGLADAALMSIEQTRVQRALDYIPGSLEWADFDPAATASAIMLLDLAAGPHRAAVEQTFERFAAAWHARREGDHVRSNYSPYEIRVIGVFVRLGRRQAALELLRFFLADRRPLAWNQWPEIVWRDARAPAHVGDVPHCWIAAEYILVLRCLFAYKSETVDALIIGAGLAAEWLEGDGVHVQDMPTAAGRLSYSLQRLDAATLRCWIAPGVEGAVVLRPPLLRAIRAVTVDGVPHAAFDRESVTLHRLPATVLIKTDARGARNA